MKAGDPREDEVLARTLAEVQRVRRRRSACKLAVLPVLLMAGAGWFTLGRGPMRAAGPSQPAVKISGPTGESHESLTVMEWKDGMPSLVKYSGRDLGRLELAFSLEPVMAFPEEAW